MKKIYVAFLLNCMAILNTAAQPGAHDLNFDPGTGANGVINRIALQSDGKIIAAGTFFSFNGTARSCIARLNSDGSLDTGFNPGSGVDNNIYTSALQSDGKIIIGGYFISYNGTARNHIARLNSNGSLDTGFKPGTGANAEVRTIAVQSDGKIIIGGGFDSYNDTVRSHIARLNSDGSLDTGFNQGTNLAGYISTIVLQSDGKIIIGGLFNSYNGTARNSIARLNSDGSLDAGFNPGTGANDSVFTTTLQSDGKIIIGGGFNFYNGTARNRIARLKSDGSLDTSFNMGTGANGPVFATTMQSAGKIIIGGGFFSYNGTARNYIARLNSDGSLDTVFNPGTGANNWIYTTALQSDGKIIIGGDFTSYNGTGRNHIARLNAIDDYNIITGVCYVDSNQNSIQDNGEPGIPNEMVSSTGSAYSFGSATNNQGVFYNISDTGSITSSPKNFPCYTISPPQHVSIFASYKNTDTIYFAFVPVAANMQDLRITLIPMNAARTGREVNYRIVYQNVGTNTMNGSVLLTMNSGLTFVSANPVYSSINGDTLQWTYSNLSPFESRSIDVTLKVPMSAVIGSTLNPSARIEPIPTDTTPNDNYLTLEQILTGAYDPNDKTTLQGDSITQKQVADGDYLDYLIRFQNTGNDTAFLVVIRDTLDNKLDWNSFEMISSSHNYSVAIRDGKNIAWTFDNILLPDSNVDEPGSHGYICYRIKPKNTILPGDIIKNTAHIFFDYNVPVATNTSITTISSPVNISSNPSAYKFLIYPNPAGEKITVLCDNPNQGQLEIFNVLGAVVLQVPLQNSITEIDISSLNKGIYFVKTDMGVLAVLKLIVQ